MSAVQTPERPSQHHCHEQARGSEHVHIGNAADVEDSDVAHKKISDRRVQRAPHHVHHRRRLSLAGRRSERSRERTATYAPTSKVTGKIDDAQVEITLTTIVAYSSYLLANHFHASGVIATVMAGLIVGNWGTQGMSPRTRVALWSFWEYAAFAMNSVLFLLIGMEVRVATLVHEWRAVGLAIGAVLLGRVLAVYGVTSLTDLVSRKIGLRWKHLLTWGGLHGALSLALALSLTSKVPYREQILTFTFAVVAFSMIAQGLSIKWLIRKLGLSTAKEDEQDRIRAQQIALSAARSELQQMFNNHVVSAPVYDRLRKEFDDRLGALSEQVSAIYGRDFRRAESELETARVRLVAAERSSLEDAIREGLILQQTDAQTADAMDSQLDQLIRKVLKKEE
jgi:Na+:H+ antiporter